MAFPVAVGVAQNDMAIGLVDRMIDDGLGQGILDRIRSLFRDERWIISFQDFCMIVLVDDDGIGKLSLECFSECRFAAMGFADRDDCYSVHMRNSVRMVCENELLDGSRAIHERNEVFLIFRVIVKQLFQFSLCFPGNFFDFVVGILQTNIA